MQKCAKCSVDVVASDQRLTCAECKGVFHPACTRTETYDNYKKLSVRKKAAWKCDGCAAETASCASLESRSDTEPSLAMLMDAFQNLSKSLGSKMAEVSAGIIGVQKELEGVNSTISVMQATLSTLVAENEQRKNEHSKMVKENVELREDVSELQQRVYEMEQYSRRDNIEIVGVPATRAENIYSVIGKLAQVLQVSYSDSQVSIAHRLSLRKGQAHPSIIVKFVRREDKVAWMRAARDARPRLTASSLFDTWPSTPVFVNDHLTAYFKMILGRAKRLVREKKIAFAWCRDCRVFVRRTASPDCPTTLLRSLKDLDNLDI